MAITPWDDIKAQVGYDELPTEGKVDTINKYSQYVQEYYTQVEPRDEKEVGQASDEFVKIASQDALGDLGVVERGSAFLGNIYKGASGTFTSAFKAAALAQQAIGESLGSYDDNTPVTERDIYKIAQNIDESVKQTTGIEDPRLRNDFINTLLPQGLGSALGFLGVAAAAAAAAPEAAVGAVGLGTAAALGAATNAGSTYEEARQAGANEFTSRASAIAGGVVGLTEAIPLGGLAGRLTAGIAKRSILRGVVEGASEEFLQETGSQMANNFIASKFAGYDPNRGIMDGALQSGAVGLVTGGLIGGGVNAITRDNEAFYADKLSDELKSKADLAASLTPERLTQITEAARNANTTTQQKIDIETGETETTSTPKTVFGDRLAGEVPDIGNNPAINSVPLGRSISQDADGNNTETFTFHTPQGLLWEAEFKTGEPVKVRDVTDDSPLLNPITSPADPRTATRSQFTGRIISPTSSIAKEFGLETEQEMDRRLIAEAQREMQLGGVTDQTLLPDNQIIPESVSRDDRGVARQVVLSNEIERLYKIREGVLARQILVGENPNAGTTEYDPNTAREVIRYDSEGNKIENKQETSQRVARLNRMIGMRETELRGLTARPEGYILASERNTPPSASQKLSLIQGFQNLWNSISSPALRNAITFEVGDITPLIESGQVPKGAVAYYKRASDGRKAMIFLSDKLATMPMARREMIHELGHAFWDTLPAGVQAEIRGLWKAETESRTGALFDEFGGLRAEVSPRVMDSVQEFFSERLAWTNDQWAKGISEKNSVMDKAGRAFRSLLDRFLRYTGHGERLNLEFRSFLDQGDRFRGLRTRVEQALEAGRAAINEEPQPSIRGLAKYEQLFDYTRNNPDGFTVDPILFNAPTTGYIVAPSKNTEGEMPLNMSREEGIKAFRSYLLSNDDIFRAYGIGQRLANVEGAGAYFGGWLKTTENNEALPKDQYKFVYDISFVLDNKTDALYVAENGKQDAIFDISAGQTIDTAPAVRDLRASGFYTPSDRGRLQELGGKVDYLAGRKGSLRTAVESIRRAVNPAVQAGRIQAQGRSLQEAGSPEVVASTRGAVSVESVPLRRDGVRLEKPSVKEVANFLQQRSIDRIQKPLTKDTPADVRMAQYLINTWSEVSYQLQQEDTGMTWYSQDIEQMESDLAQLYPESIDSIEEKMVLFKAMLVGNSFSQTPKAETLTTMRIWDSSNQQFPVKPRQDDGKGWTVRGGTVEIYLSRINRLVAEKGEKGAADWLLSKHPIKELREYNPNVGGKQDDLKYGSMIFGQKGGAYHLNMNGNYDVLTADLHFSRMWNRMMGTVLDANGEIIQAPTPAELKIQDEAVRFASDKLGLSVAELQAVSWVYEIGLWKDLGAKIGYYKHSDGTAKLLQERGIQRREVVPDSRAIEERRQTALSRANALSDGRDTQQVLPEEVRASTRGIQASTRGEQAQRLLEPVISFGRQQLRTGGALPYDIFRMTEQRGFNVNEKLLRARNAVSDIEAAVKRSYAKSLDQLPEAEIARINEGLQNPLARAKLPTDVASAVGNARNLIDSLTQDLLRSGAISEDLKPVLEANKGVYLNRSYEKWENPNYKNPFNTLPKQVQNKLVTTVTSYLHNKYANAYAKEQSLSRGEVAINPDSGTYQADYQAGLAKARSGGVTKAEVDGQIEYLASPETDSPFGQIGSGLTKDLSIITARKNIPEEIRMLWGEIKDPRVNFLKSVQKMSGFLEAHNMLKGMRDAGMNKIFFTTPRTGFTTKLVSDGSRTASPLNMFIDGMKNDVYTSEEISTALRNTFGGRAKAQDFLGKMSELYLKANGFSKFAKTVLSVQTQVRNLLGNGSFLVANGYIFSPDGITALNKLKTLALPSAGTQLGLNKSKEFRDYNAKLTRLGILGQSVFANEMESYFKDANVNTAADFLDNHVTKGLKAIARGATSLYQLGDAIPKIVAFEVELSRLRKAYPTQPLSKLEPMAADKVLNLLPTYSRIPRLGNVLRSQPFVGAFISFPLEVVRTGYNLLGTINDELRSDNPAIRQAGAYRLAGTMMASIGFSAVAAGIAAAMGIDDDEDMAIRKLDAPWDKYSTKLYLGRDEKGNVNQVNMSYVDPYNYFRDPIIALIKRDGTWDQKLLESVKTAFQPLYGEQILSSKILDITRNTKGTTGGRVYNPEADLASKASAISSHMFDAFNIGTFTSSIRIYKGLTGQVTQTGRAYDPALETIATLTGQRVVSLDPRQSLGFAARKFSNRLNDATGIFTAAYYDRSNVSNEARMEAYKQMSRSRKEIFNDTAGTIRAAMKLGVSRGEIMRILKEQGVSMDNSRALLSGLVAVYKPAKREMKGDAIRFRQQVYAGQ